MGGILRSNDQAKIFIDQAISSSFTSIKKDVGSTEYGFALQLHWTGTAIDMSAKLQASLDGSNWVDMSDTVEALTEDDGSHIWDITQSNVEYIRVVISVTGGSGTFTCLFNGKSRR